MDPNSYFYFHFFALVNYKAPQRKKQKVESLLFQEVKFVMQNYVNFKLNEVKKSISKCSFSPQKRKKLAKKK